MGHRQRHEEGAALVEFALLAPLLVLLILGIVEFGWLFAQMNQIRHVSQEAARWGAVSRPDLSGDGVMNWTDLAARACGAANLPSATVLAVAGDPGTGIRGDTATVTVTASVQSLSGLSMITVFLPTTLTNTDTFRLEQDATWAIGSTTC